jgi:hypothetical protein
VECLPDTLARRRQRRSCSVAFTENEAKKKKLSTNCTGALDIRRRRKDAHGGLKVITSSSQELTNRVSPPASGGGKCERPGNLPSDLISVGGVQNSEYNARQQKYAGRCKEYPFLVDNEPNSAVARVGWCRICSRPVGGCWCN